MRIQEKLTDMQGNPLKLSFYSYSKTPDLNPILVLQKGEKNKFWAARYIIGGSITDKALNQLYFKDCIPISDEEVKEIIRKYEHKAKEYEKKARVLRTRLKEKKDLEQLAKQKADSV